MDSSKGQGSAEECSSSCESGWTMQERTSQQCDDDDSDDSMASDASSGPSQPHHTYGSPRGSHVLGFFKHLQREDQSKSYSSGKKPCKEEEQKTYEKGLKAEKKTPANSSYSGAKVSKASKMERK
ncbi:hypothetical protein NMG60_11009438 [Bertholletia excelsa]